MSIDQEHEQLLRYYTDLRQQVLAAVEASEEGGFREEQFTQVAIDLLSENGDTENARECRDGKADAAGRILHRVNGYALSEGAENLDLFVTIYKGNEKPGRLTGEEVIRAFNQCRKFLNIAFKGYWQEMAESAPAFDFAREICYKREHLVRANLFLLTDCESSIETPKSDYLNKTNLLLSYRIVDLNYLYRLDCGQPDPIVINFEETAGHSLPCLIIPADNEKYMSFLAVVPGTMLSDIYEKYGSRLLEMNVRSFLQFTGKINKGIRETIMKEPHMFLAYNNGITATAESVELTADGTAIRSISEFQIVNGGQTTAGIFHTRRKNKADISRVFVQMKLSVIKDQINLDDIVKNISRCANSQNKVSDADLSANSPFQIQMEKLSRMIWAPPRPGQSQQTRWFYERARAQYRNAVAREFTPARKKAFELQNPRKQMLVKEELAKFVNAWEQLPYFVVLGSQKNYNRFISSLKKSEQKPDSIFFENAVAKAILFRTAEEVYGRNTKTRTAIGDMRYISVPYSIAWLSRATEGRIDLFKIWKQQSLSNELRELLFNLMKCVDDFIKLNAPGALYGEWAKKEACWQEISKQSFDLDLNTLTDDFNDPDRPQNRGLLTDSEAESDANETRAEWLRSVPVSVWKTIGEWGYSTGKLSLRQRDLVYNLTKAMEIDRRFTDSEIDKGCALLDQLLETAPELFKDIKDENPHTKDIQPGGSFSIHQITLDIVQQLVAWDRKNKRLLPHHYIYMKEIADGSRALSEHTRTIVQTNIDRLARYGFTPNME